MKRALLIIVTMMSVLGLFGARLLNQPLTVYQPDGTALDIRVSGDEFHNWLHDARGYTIIKDPQTDIYTWAVEQGGTVVPSPYRADTTNPVELGIPTGVNLTPEQIRQKHNRFWGGYGPVRNSRAPHWGDVNNLVVFIKFANSPNFTHTISYYDNMFNNQTLNANSMRNYFWAVSYNQMDISTSFYPPPDNQTIVCYTDPQPRGYYSPVSTGNPIGYDPNDDNDRATREFQLLANATNYIAGMVPGTLDLDADDDGLVDNVCYIVQGAPDGWASLLWPHRWALYGAEVYIGTARVWDFNLQLETFLNDSGASVLCHEMTHTLGAPDLYRYYDSTIDPIGSWDIMCGNTNPPQQMGAWMKYKYLDWVTTVPTISQSGVYTINALYNSTNNVYRLPSWRTGEYYIVEYRKGFGIYDNNIPGCGLLVYRLDVSEDGNAEGPPDELYIYRPGGINTTTNGEISLAHFSQQTGRTFMNEATNPNGFMSNEAPGGLDISQISASGGETMTFRVDISNVQVTNPVGGEVLFGGSELRIQWKARSYVSNVRIDYSVDNGATWLLITASAPNNGEYIWTSIPSHDSQQCYIKVTQLSNNAVDTCNYPFTILSNIMTPEPVFPPNNLTNAPTNPTFSWNQVLGATGYHLQVSLDNDFINNNIISLVDHPDTTFTYNNLNPFTTYYWRVAASAPGIGESSFSESYVFTTGDVSILPTAPLLVYPLNSATNIPRNPTLLWNAGAYAYTYHVQLATNSFFTTLVFEQDNIAGTQYTLSPLAANTRFYWRVRAHNPAGYSPYSAVRSFTTGDYIVTGTDDQFSPAALTSLEQNNPNPFSHSTEIGFYLAEKKQAFTLQVFNMKGQCVRTLFSGSAGKGRQHVMWDGNDDKGKPVANGVYYYRLETGKQTHVRKLLLIR